MRYSKRKMIRCGIDSLQEPGFKANAAGYDTSAPCSAILFIRGCKNQILIDKNTAKKDRQYTHLYSPWVFLNRSQRAHWENWKVKKGIEDIKSLQGSYSVESHSLPIKITIITMYDVNQMTITLKLWILCT